ncbi:LuxR family transcriptional regulator [Azorhizobium oxalatiphilum]|uniref:LuxR family transcriptional regulator n=1 Tax=Azorhizobium oxalatiphilum TaxID=980631 RepID=A0A917CKS6_9HYPH|nr:LuxR family transcriptional regulator [Azorhizobium oxalatiphilum]
MPIKFRPALPSIPLVERPRLLALLDSALEVPLTIVQAPPGFGKTTLLGQWRQELMGRGYAVPWLSVDRHDSDPTVFALSMLGALDAIAPEPERLLQPGQATDSESLFAQIVQALTGAGRPFIFFLDDYHFAEQRENDLLLQRLLRVLPPHVHLIVATRTRPSLGLPEMQASGKLLHLKAEHLRFEAQESLSMLESSFATAEIAVLAERTQGWPVALQIARVWAADQGGLDKRIAGFSGSTEDMAAYMVDQVMEELPEPARDLLIRTAILDSIDGDIANHLCARTDCWETLEKLERLNPLFYPVDAGRTTFRHHHLFREFLLARLRQQGEAPRRTLHLRAADWLAGKGMVFEAVEHARAAGEPDAALAILEHAGLFHRILREGADRYRSFKILFTPEALARYPRITVAQALLWIKDGDPDGARALLSNLRDKLDAGDYSDVGAQLDLDIAVMEGFLSNYVDGGVTSEALAAMERFVTTIPPHEPWYRALVHNLICTMRLHRGDLIGAGHSASSSIEQFSLAGLQYGLFFMTQHEARLRMLRGHLGVADRKASDAARIARMHFPEDRTMQAHVRILQAALEYERNELESEVGHLPEALTQLERADGWVEVYLAAYRVALGTAFSRAGLAGLQPLLIAGRNFARRRDMPRIAWFLEAREAHYTLLAGDITRSRQLVEANARNLALLEERFDATQTWSERAEHRAMRARLLIAEGSVEAARAMLVPLIAGHEAAGLGWYAAQAYLLLALAEQALGQPEAAFAALREALQRTGDGRTLRLFVEEGPAVSTLSMELLAGTGTSALPALLVPWLREVAEAVHAASDTTPLTPREREVFELLRQGCANKRIARALGITDNAVKFHLKNIFRKLGLRGRREVTAMGAKQVSA